MEVRLEITATDWSPEIRFEGTNYSYSRPRKERTDVLFCCWIRKQRKPLLRSGAA